MLVSDKKLQKLAKTRFMKLHQFRFPQCLLSSTEKNCGLQTPNPWIPAVATCMRGYNAGCVILFLKDNNRSVAGGMFVCGWRYVCASINYRAFVKLPHH